jgi:glutamate-1-semialdehyde 2,1-aminomutase
MAAFDATRQGPAIPHGGTFNANPLTMQAGLATLRQLTPAVYDRLNDYGLAFRHQLEEMARSYGAPCRISGIASFFGVQLTARPVTDYRSAQGQNAVLRQKLFLHLLNHGIYVGSKLVGNLSVPMGRNELDHFVAAWEGFLRQLVA